MAFYTFHGGLYDCTRCLAYLGGEEVVQDDDKEYSIYYI